MSRKHKVEVLGVVDGVKDRKDGAAGVSNCMALELLF
jgi:hypothetical protein